MTFYQKVHRLCESKGFLVSELGEHAGFKMTVSTASSWKTRGSIPHPSTILKIADYFDVPVEWLTDDSQGFEFDPEAADPMNEKMKELWSRMTIVQRAELLVKAVEILG